MQLFNLLVPYIEKLLGSFLLCIVAFVLATNPTTFLPFAAFLVVFGLQLFFKSKSKAVAQQKALNEPNYQRGTLVYERKRFYRFEADPLAFIQCEIPFPFIFPQP